MAVFTANSQLESAAVGKIYKAELGTSGNWRVPPGSLLPPGLHLDKNNGVIFGVPTIPGVFTFFIDNEAEHRQFIVEIQHKEDISESRINELIEARREIFYEEDTDSEGKKILAIKVIRNGQKVTIASATIN